MMGLPCLRHNGHFFAACDRRTGNLLAKLPEARVTELLEAGHAGSVCPRGPPVPPVGRHPRKRGPHLGSGPRRGPWPSQKGIRAPVPDRGREDAARSPFHPSLTRGQARVQMAPLGAVAAKASRVTI